MALAVPPQQASNGEGYVFNVEGTCDCSFELYTPLSAAHVRDQIVSRVHEAVRAETMQGGWRYHNSNNSDEEKKAYAERVMARLLSSAGPQAPESPPMKIDFRNYCVTSVQFDPMATLAAVVHRAQDPAVSLLAASIIDIFRGVNKDGTRNVEETVEASAEATTSFVRSCGSTVQPALPPPPGRRWILGLLRFVLAVALLLPIYVSLCAFMFPEKWAAHKDAIIEAYAQSFKHHTLWGYLGESLVQRKDRLIAEQELQLLQKMEEEERKKKDEERRKKEEEHRARLEAEALYERTLTPWQRFLYRNNVGDRRFKRYRRP